MESEGKKGDTGKDKASRGLTLARPSFPNKDTPANPGPTLFKKTDTRLSASSEFDQVGAEFSIRSGPIVGMLDPWSAGFQELELELELEFFI
jgi:hypothetical protein